MTRAEDIYQKIIAGGERVIEDFIRTRESESLFLDFKRSADNGEGTHLHPHDRKNLSKAVSGFGNSEGGVIVWGVDCCRNLELGDVASAKVPLAAPERFKSWLEGAVSGCTIPAHTGVVSDVVRPGPADLGYVATLIPRSSFAPHQCTTEYRYYIRAGSSFSPATHSVIAGMFGRRPQPEIGYLWQAEPLRVYGAACVLEGVLLLSNQGYAIARELFVNSLAQAPEGMRLELHPQDGHWEGNYAQAGRLSLISREQVRLAPRGLLPALHFEVRIEPPLKGEYRLELVVGCQDAPMQVFQRSVPGRELERALERFRDHQDELALEAELKGLLFGPETTAPQR